MTREEMALECEQADETIEAEWGPGAGKLLFVAEELRKTCATCQHWARNKGPEYYAASYCFAKGMYRGSQPEDGSGFCHRWGPKQ